MNKLLNDLIKSLGKNPLISSEDIQMVKRVMENVYLEKKMYAVTGVYPNFSYKKDRVPYDDLPRYVWYNIKYKQNRFLLVDGELLNYDLSLENKNHIEKVIISLKRDNKIE